MGSATKSYGPHYQTREDVVAVAYSHINNGTYPKPF